MELDIVFEYLKGLAPWVAYVLAGLGALVVMGASYVKLTPTQSDDAWWAKLEAMPVVGGLLTALVKFSPFSRK